MEQAGNEAQGVTDTISNGETALWMKGFFSIDYGYFYYYAKKLHAKWGS